MSFYDILCAISNLIVVFVSIRFFLICYIGPYSLPAVEQPVTQYGDELDSTTSDKAFQAAQANHHGYRPDQRQTPAGQTMEYEPAAPGSMRTQIPCTTADHNTWAHCSSLKPLVHSPPPTRRNKIQPRYYPIPQAFRVNPETGKPFLCCCDTSSLCSSCDRIAFHHAAKDCSSHALICGCTPDFIYEHCYPTVRARSRELYLKYVKDRKMFLMRFMSPFLQTNQAGFSALVRTFVPQQVVLSTYNHQVRPPTPPVVNQTLPAPAPPTAPLVTSSWGMGTSGAGSLWKFGMERDLKMWLTNTQKLALTGSFRKKSITNWLQMKGLGSGDAEVLFNELFKQDANNRFFSFRNPQP